jgi:uncharacterized membrane protein (DUF373 family)
MENARFILNIILLIVIVIVSLIMAIWYKFAKFKNKGVKRVTTSIVLMVLITLYLSLFVYINARSMC